MSDLYTSEEEFENAMLAYEDNDDEPIPVTCKNPDCGAALMEYDMMSGVYTCPVCGKEVTIYEALDYLSK